MSVQRSVGYNSLSTRLSLRILIVVLTVMTLMGGAMVQWNVMAVRKLMAHHYEVLLDVTNELVEYDLRSLRYMQANDTARDSRKRSLEWLRQWLNQQDLKINKKGLKRIVEDREHSPDFWIYSVVIDSEGNYVSHPDSLYMLNENFFRQVSEGQDSSTVRMLQDIRSGVGGEAKAVIEGRNMKVFYDPLQHTGWTMAIIVPQKLEDSLSMTQSFLQMLSIFIALLFIYFICHLTIRHTTRPLKALAESADEVAKGRFDVPLPKIHQKDEVSLLRDSFEDMQQSLGKYIEQLQTTTAEKASMENELDIARKIQMAMLPSTFPERSDVEVYASMTPAKEVGGDLYDFFLRDGKFLFCIGDVTGKGVPAAMVMTVSKILFRAYASKEDNPETIVRQMNEMISDNNDVDIFVTFFVGVLDLSSGYLRYCSAGHEPPILMGADASVLPFTPALPLGCFADSPYQSHEYLIEPDTTLFLFTDGLTESDDGQGNMFERKRVIDVARRAIDEHQQSPKAFIELVSKTLNAFVGNAEQSDDLTMMAIRYLSPGMIRMKASASDYPRMTAFVMDAAGKAHLSDYMTGRLRLAVEETVGNVIDYSGATDIMLVSNIRDERLTVTVIDDGKAFNPTAAPVPDMKDVPADERRPGGLGILYMREMSDSLEYHRVGDKNVLMIRLLLC